MESPAESESDVLEEARAYIKEAAGRLDRVTSSDETRRGLQSRLDELRQAVLDRDATRSEELLRSTKSYVAEHVEFSDKSAFREYAESIGLAILLALMLRGFVVEAFKIPTGSMIPTLLVGDHIFVNKFIYGIRVPFTDEYVVRFSEPSRGEIVVFSFPSEEARAHLAAQPAGRRDCIDQGSLHESKDFIKRIVGVEGDVVELEENRLIINGTPLGREFQRKVNTGSFLYPHEVHELETNERHTYTIQYTGSDPDFGPVKIKRDHVLVMGDNRDNSSDGRCWGQVPIDNIKGRAMIVWWSIGPESIRWDRIGTVIQ